MEKKKLTVPFVAGLDRATDIESFSAMLTNAVEETQTGSAQIDTVNWPDDFPYKPFCKVNVGWCKKGIGILYTVNGLDLRAQALEDNGPVWEDSCCEFFVADPADGTYYNFELNCIGTLLAAKRKNCQDCTHYHAEQLKQIRRFSTLEHEAVEINDKEFSWNSGLFIPFRFMGIDPENMPDTVSANFYKCGDKTAHIHFVSWSPIGCEKPDFHRPEYFGTLEFAKPILARRCLIYPVLMALYFIAVGFLCFGHFDSIDMASGMFLGIPTDKIVHFSMFFPFPLLAYATFGRKIKGNFRTMLSIVLIFATGCILAIGTELGQGLTDYRSCDINDFRADAIGMAVSSIILVCIEFFRRKNK